MEDLLTKYSVSDIIIFIITLALAIKGLITFVDWVFDRNKKVFNKDYDKKKQEQELQEQLKQNHDSIAMLTQNQVELANTMQQLSEKIDMLIDSDRDDIKAFLTREHHYFCYQKGWIDDYSLECCERRFKHYTDEGGNSFIAGFMDDMRKLPKTQALAQSPQQ